MNSPPSNPDLAAPLPSTRQILSGVLDRLVLPLAAFVLVLWNMLFLTVSFLRMPDNDFGRIYYSAVSFVHDQDMYAKTKATAAQVGEDWSIDLYNLNPPHFHVLVLPLTLLPERAALALWWVFSAVCLLLCLHLTAAEIKLKLTARQRSLALLFFLAFAPTADILFVAQVSFVLLVPVLLMWLAARRGLWGLSGIFLGLLVSMKPFFGIFLAFYIWRRHWRALASSLVTTAAVFGLGILVFGAGNYDSWVARLGSASSWGWLPTNASLMGTLVRCFQDSLRFEPLLHVPTEVLWLAWASFGGMLGLLTIAATTRGSSPRDADHNFSLLLLAAVLLSPLGWIYYLWFAVPPLATLFAAGWLQERQPLAAGPGSWRRRLVYFALAAICWPVIGTLLLQPSPVATLVFACVYFWSLLALTGVLIRDGLLEWETGSAAPQVELVRLEAADYRISVVMPVYSETDTVEQTSTWLIRELGSRLEEIVIVQSPRSSEASRAVCRELTERCPQVRLQTQRNNPGLGNAVREGYAAVRGNVVLNIDSDGEMEIETVHRLLAEMARGNHGLVTASRWLPGGGFSGYSGLKYYLNWAFQQMFRWLFWTRLTDLTYGFKLVRAELVHGISWEGTLHEIACETTLKPIRLGVSAAEVPSKWTARTQGVSKNTFWRNFRYVRTALCILWQGVPYAASTQVAPEEPCDTAQNAAYAPALDGMSPAMSCHSECSC